MTVGTKALLGSVCTITGRVLEGASGLAWLVAPFLPFACVPVKSLVVPVPGWILHGWVVGFAGAAVLWLATARRRWPLAVLALALVVGVALYIDHQLISKRIDYLLRSLQLSLIDVNSIMIHLGLAPWHFAPAAEHPSYAGPGFMTALRGVEGVSAGALLVIVGQLTAGKQSRQVFLGLGRRCLCRHVLPDNVQFCPSCGRHVGEKRVCPNCAAVLLPPYSFCASCGAEQSERASEANE